MTISEKYKNLSDACKKYPEIVLHGDPERFVTGTTATIIEEIEEKKGEN